MNRTKILTIIIAVVLISSLVWNACEKKAEGKITLETETDQISYIMGIQKGKQIKTMPFVINPDAFAMGIKDVQADNELAMSEEEMKSVLTKFQERMRAQQQAQNPEAQKN